MNHPLLVLLTVVSLGGVSHASPQRSNEPVCHGVAGKPRWSSKVVGKHVVRFMIDASDVDTCTEYYDLEFVITILNSRGAPIATRRFTLPGVQLKGPSMESFDFK